MNTEPTNRRQDKRSMIIAIVALGVIIIGVASTLQYYSSSAAGTSSTARSYARSSTISSEESASSSSETTTDSVVSSESSSSIETTVIHYFVPCNCSVDLNWAWPTFNNMSSLVSNSDFIVVANVTSATTIGANASNPYITVDSLVPVTGYSINVTSVLSGPPGPTIGTEWLLVQIGGMFNHTTMGVMGYPSLSVGHSYVLFLQGVSTFHVSSLYGAFNNGLSMVTVGGPQGLFQVQNGEVYSMNTLYPAADSWLPVQADGIPLSQFISEVQGNSSTSSISGSSLTSSN